MRVESGMPSLSVSWHLAAGQAQTLEQPCAARLTVVSGRLWLTGDGAVAPGPGDARDARDLFLGAGESIVLQAGQSVVIEAWPLPGAGRENPVSAAGAMGAALCWEVQLPVPAQAVQPALLASVLPWLRPRGTLPAMLRLLPSNH